MEARNYVNAMPKVRLETNAMCAIVMSAVKLKMDQSDVALLVSMSRFAVVITSFCSHTWRVEIINKHKICFFRKPLPKQYWSLSKKVEKPYSNHSIESITVVMFAQTTRNAQYAKQHYTKTIVQTCQTAIFGYAEPMAIHCVTLG